MAGSLVTTSTSTPSVAPCSTTVFLNPASTHDLARRGWAAVAWSSRLMPMALSLLLTAVTTTASSRPMVSVMTPRLRPTIFLPASVPCVDSGTLVDVLTLWVSMMDAVGVVVRPAWSRTSPVRV